MPNLLFDQNISFRVVKKLIEHFPNCAQVRDLGLEGNTDAQIWAFAQKNDFVVVTFDADFSDLASFYGHPPKVIWLRTGNTTTDEIVSILIGRKKLIHDFIEGVDYSEISCLELY
jgi:predicted nuclease of predicted toxin-antitoxin system